MDKDNQNLEKAAKYCQRLHTKWTGMLDKKLSENRYQAVIEQNAHFFLPMGVNGVQVLSKIRLGAEHITDFVQVFDEGSNGLSYNLIEIESPHSPPFTKEGIISQRLSRAIYQVLGWKKWLETHSSEARRLFPSYLHLSNEQPLFTFSIIIGRRNHDSNIGSIRKQLSHSLGVNIISFDRLTDCLKRWLAYPSIMGVYIPTGHEEQKMPLSLQQALGNPFVQAMSDPEWRDFIAHKFECCHMLDYNAERLMKARKYTKY